MTPSRAEQAEKARLLIEQGGTSAPPKAGEPTGRGGPEKPDREPVAAKVGDFIVDEETGEILELPEGVGEPIEWLTFKAAEADAAQKAWAQLFAIYKAAIGKKLDDAQLKKMRTKYGSPGWRARLNRRARIERLPILKEVFELTANQVGLILTCAKELDVNALLALPPEAVPPEVIKLLIDESESAWVQVSPLTPAPPPIERKPIKR